MAQRLGGLGRESELFVIEAGAQLIEFAEIDSTNAEAARRAACGDVGPAWLVARTQTAGRGRRGRSWMSEPGNLFVTYLGATSLGLQRIAQLGFAAALGVGDVVDAVTHNGTARMKWPNDVLIGGAKTCGILPESGVLDGGRHWFALGIGVNIASAPQDLAYKATCLNAAAGRDLTVGSVLGLLQLRVSFWARELGESGFTDLRSAWLARAHGVGAIAQARLGEETLEGRFESLDPEGAMQLRLADGALRAISAGEVFFPTTEAD